MGQERTIRFSTPDGPSWEDIRSNLLRVEESGTLRMIDGLPAFPDEAPPADWKELRVATQGGMVTIRRGTETLSCVSWGTEEPGLILAWNRVIWACSAAGNGMVDTPSGPVSAEAFALSVGVASS